MRAILTGFQNELLKIKSRKKYFIFLIVYLTVLTAIIALGKAGGEKINLTIPGLSFSVLPITLDFVLPLFIFSLAAELFSAEQDNSTIKASLLCPVNRYQIYTAKAMAILTCCAIFLGLTCVYQLFLDLFFAQISASILELIVSCLISLFPEAVIILFAIWISQITKSSTGMFFLSVILYLGLSVLPLFIPEVRAVLFTSNVNIYKMFIGAGSSLKLIAIQAGMMIGYGLLFASHSLYLFQKKEY